MYLNEYVGKKKKKRKCFCTVLSRNHITCYLLKFNDCVIIDLIRNSHGCIKYNIYYATYQILDGQTYKKSPIVTLVGICFSLPGAEKACLYS